MWGTSYTSLLVGIVDLLERVRLQRTQSTSAGQAVNETRCATRVRCACSLATELSLLLKGLHMSGELLTYTTGKAFFPCVICDNNRHVEGRQL